MSPVRILLLLAGLACIGLALWTVVGDARAAAAGEVVQPRFFRLLVLSLLGGALVSASRYKR